MWCRNSRRGKRGCGARPPARGFTLIEVLVSMVLLAVILTLLFTSFFQISTGSKRLQEELIAQQELRLLLKMMVDDLQAAQYFRHFVESGGGASGIVADRRFEGTTEFSRIRFHAALPARFYRQVPAEQDPGTHEVAYWVEPSEEDRNRMVLMRREDFYLDDDMDEGGVSAELVEGIKVFSVKFLPPGDRDEESEDLWEDEWDSAEKPKSERMPLAIRVTLALENPNGTAVTDSLEVNLPPTLEAKK